MKQRIPYIPRKGKSKRDMWLALEELRKQGYDIPPPKTQPQQPIALQKKHEGHHTMLVRGQWGPHRAKQICRDCDGAFIQWVRAQK